MQKELDKLLEKSYSPYSGIKVSSIIKTNNGKKYFGVNIENASYTPTICAERNAIFNAITNGEKKGNFKEIHLTSNRKDFLYPCGVCRQVMTEFFDKKTTIHIWNNGIEKIYSLDELLPHKVVKESLK